MSEPRKETVEIVEVVSKLTNYLDELESNHVISEEAKFEMKGNLIDILNEMYFVGRKHAE